MNENSFNGSLNKDFGAVKIGGSYLKKIRNFQARIFRYDAVDLKKNDICSIDIIRFDDTNFMISVVKSQDYNLRYYLQAK